MHQTGREEANPCIRRLHTCLHHSSFLLDGGVHFGECGCTELKMNSMC